MQMAQLSLIEAIGSWRDLRPPRPERRVL